MTSPWTPQLTERLTELWSGALSASQIGTELGVTKSAVVGKAYRLELPARMSPILYGNKARVTPPRKKTLASATPPHMARLLATKFRPARACLWIEGERGVDFKLYADAPRCHEKVKPGSSYCPFHHDRCNIKLQPRRAA